MRVIMLPKLLHSVVYPVPCISIQTHFAHHRDLNLQRREARERVVRVADRGCGDQAHGFWAGDAGYGSFGPPKGRQSRGHAWVRVALIWLALPALQSESTWFCCWFHCSFSLCLKHWQLCWHRNDRTNGESSFM